MKYKLIVSDLDGTLLNNKTEISERTLSAIGRYRAAGGLFSFATGRSEESARPFVEKAGIIEPVISFNGGKIYDYTDGGVLFETFLDAGASKNAYKALRALGKDVVVYLDKRRYIGEYTAVIDKYLEKLRHGVYFINNIDQVFSDGIPLKKLLVIDPEQEGDLIVSSISPFFTCGFNCVKSDPQFYEILPPGTSKGEALALLAAHFGVGLGETIAIGDHLNDVSMIKTAGLGVAVANAERETLEAANYITGSNDDDGVAQVIEKFAL